MTVSMQQINAEIQHQNWNAAARDLHAGLQQHPESVKGWYYLAQVEGKLNHLPEAKAALARADSIDPTHSYAGNMTIYNELYSRVNYAQAPATTTQAPVEHVASVQHHAYQSNVQSSNASIWIGGSVLLAVVIGAVWFFKRKKAVPSLRPVTTPAPTATTSEASPSRQRVIDEIRTTPARVVPEPYVQVTPRTVAPTYSTPTYIPPTPAPTRNSSGTSFVEGMVVGALADEAVSALTGRRSSGSSSSSPSFDYGSDDSSSSSSSSGFDFGSSSSSSSSSDSSFDFGGSSSFDSGSDMGGSSDW